MDVSEQVQHWSFYAKLICLGTIKPEDYKKIG